MEKIKKSECIYKIHFDENGKYEFYTAYNLKNSHTYIYKCSAEQKNQILSNIDSIINNKIQSGDKLYFTKNTPFPKRIFNQLGLDISRTINKDKADKIIIDNSLFKFKKELSNIKIDYLIEQPNSNNQFYIDNHNIKYYKNTYNFSLENLQEFFKGNWIPVIAIDAPFKQDIIDNIINNNNKIVPIKTVSEYLNSKIPSLNEEEFKTIISMLTSTEDCQMTALKLIVTENISDYIFEIFQEFSNKSVLFSNKIKNSIEFKYFLSLLGCKVKNITNSWHWRIKNRSLLSDIFNTGTLSEKSKFKIYKTFFKDVTDEHNYIPNYDFSDYEKECFLEYDMPLIYDENRTSKSSNRKMEESGL